MQFYLKWRNIHGGGYCWKRALVVALIAALVVTSAFAGAWGPGGGEAYAAGSNLPEPYPWSKTAAPTTGDYIADVYDGIEPGQHVFEDVTVDRLADVLSAAGDYYVVFASPTKPTAQKILGVINEQAKKDGIKKIYHFNPVLDNKYLDITLSDAAIKALGQSSVTTNFVTTPNAEGTNAPPAGAADLSHTIGNIQTYINYFLPNDEKGDLIRAYKSDQTLLFRFHKDAHTDLASEAAIGATYQLKPANISYGYNKTTQATNISQVFKDADNNVVKGDVRTDFDFFERAYRNALPTEDVITEEKYPAGKGFNVKALTLPAAFNLLNSPGEHAIYFGEIGCGNTKATIGFTARQAKKYNRTVYFIDGSLDGSVRFKFGVDIDSQLGSTSNAWINIRLGQRSDGNIPTGYAGVGHLYGALFSYFGDGISTQNWSSLLGGNNAQSVFYYENGYDSATGTPTNRPFGTGASDEGPFDAPRLQYPYLLSYNKDYEQPVTISTTAIQYNGENTNGTPKLAEYMLGVANVNYVWNSGWKPGDAYPNSITNINNATARKLHLDGLTDYDKIINPDYLASVRALQGGYIGETGGNGDDQGGNGDNNSGTGGNGDDQSGAGQTPPTRTSAPEWTPDPTPQINLTESVRGVVEAKNSAPAKLNETVKLFIGANYAGQYVFVRIYSDPIDLGWHLVNDAGEITVTIPATAAPGDHKLAVQNDKDELIGWAPVTVAAQSETVQPPAGETNAVDTGKTDAKAAKTPAKAKTYKVTFNANKGKKLATDSRSKKVTAGKKYGNLPKVTRAGLYRFAGWYTKKNGGVKVTSSTKVKAGKNHTLWAHWQVRYGELKGAYVLKVRRSPEVSGSVAGYLTKKTKFRIIKESGNEDGGWHKIRFSPAEGRTVTGYVYSPYIAPYWK
jgi:hypothetical protein